MSEYNPNIFLVDDDEAVRDSLGLLMKSVALTSRSFASAAEFLAAYDPDCPGCLILDIRMPGMSGMELQQKLIDIGGDIANHIYFCTRRYSDGRRGIATRGHRLYSEAIS